MIVRSEIVSSVRVIARRIGRTPQSRDLGTKLYRQVRIVYRSMEALWNAAGLAPPPQRRRWTAEVIVAELRRLHRARVRLSGPGLSAAGHGGLVSVSRYHGGLVALRRRAGVPEPALIRAGR